MHCVISALCFEYDIFQGPVGPPGGVGLPGPVGPQGYDGLMGYRVARGTQDQQERRATKETWSVGEKTYRVTQPNCDHLLDWTTSIHFIPMVEFRWYQMYIEVVESSMWSNLGWVTNISFKDIRPITIV